MKFFLILLCLLPFTSSLRAEGEKVIAILRDGKSEYFDQFIASFSQELTDLSEGKYHFVLQEEMSPKDSVYAIEKKLKTLLKNPHVDIIYAAGVIGSQLALQLDPSLVTKPIVAGVVDFSSGASHLISPQGTSRIQNVTFVVAPHRLSADLENLHVISKAKKIVVFVSQSSLAAFPKAMNRQALSLAKQLGVKIQLVGLAPPWEKSKNHIPEHLEAAYIGLLPDWSDKERFKLIESLSKRGVMTFSFRGYSDVKAGAFGGLATANFQKTLVRRTAINIHQILSGLGIELLPVVLNSYDQLTINLATARQIGWSLDYQTGLRAFFLNGEAEKQGGKTLTMDGVMERISRLKPEVLAARENYIQEVWRKKALGNSLRPQLSLNAGINAQGTHHAINPLTSPKRLTSLSLGLEMRTILYSDRVNSQLKAQKHLVRAVQEDGKSVELDAIESAARAFLQVIYAREMWRIERENLFLLENNLQLAKLRRDIGVAEQSEVFRWQTQLAQARALLIQRDATLKNARIGLNAQMAVGLDTRWEYQDVFCQKGVCFAIERDIEHCATNLKEYTLFSRFVRDYALENSPEMRGFALRLLAQGVRIHERRHRHLRPEIVLSASAGISRAQVRDYSASSQEEWAVGIQFSLPLWEGDLRRSEVGELESQKRQLEDQYTQASFLLAQRAMAATYALFSSYPGLSLSKQSLIFSQKNYDAIKNKYIQGAVSILELLDAQNQLIAQRQAVASARFTYLGDLISLQRAMAWYEPRHSKKEQKYWSKQLHSYFKTGSLHVQTH